MDAGSAPTKTGYSVTAGQIRALFKTPARRDEALEIVASHGYTMVEGTRDDPILRDSLGRSWSLDELAAEVEARGGPLQFDLYQASMDLSRAGN